MNINDVANPSDMPENILAFIFQRQKELMAKYETIELKNGLLHTDEVPVDLHDRFGQARLKEMAWRTTEEVAEAMEVYFTPEGNRDHFQEEMADALHFLVEMAILSGFEHHNLTAGESLHNWWGAMTEEVESHSWSIVELVTVFITHLGITCNNLKNKPWKQTQMLTDEAKYRRDFHRAFHAFLSILVACGMTPESMLNLYFRKSEVNKFRQRSNY